MRGGMGREGVARRAAGTAPPAPVPLPGAGRVQPGGLQTWGPLGRLPHNRRVHDDGSSAALASLATELAGASVGDDLHLVVQRAVSFVGPAEHATITLRAPRRRLRTIASTSQVCLQADELQYSLGEGPCVDAATGDEICLLDDAARPERWKRWAGEVRGLGLNSVLAIQLGRRGSYLGALNLYSSRPQVFTCEEIDLAASYAAVAGAALHASRQVEGLETAVHTRHLIGVAQGILMAQFDLTIDQAFALMQRCSSRLNIKVRDLAAHVATHGQLPEGWGGDAAPDRSGPPVPSGARVPSAAAGRRLKNS